MCVCVCAYVVRIRWSKDDFRNRLLSNQEPKKREREREKKLDVRVQQMNIRSAKNS